MDRTNRSAITPLEVSLLTIIAAVLCFFWNRAFLDWVSLPKILVMHDVPAILQGYEKVHRLFPGSGAWWTGTWIQEGIHAYRPLASYLYWIESAIGLHWGFIWVGWIGVMLLVLNALLSGALAWRLTKWKPAVLLAVVLAVALRFFNWAGATPDYWLAWYPVHQELLMNALLIGAIIAFDTWYENAQNRYLFLAWFCFVAGALTKEHVYIFPAFAIAIALLRRRGAVIKLPQALFQCGLMSAAILALWIYRANVIIDPRNPHLRLISLIRKPFLYCFYPFYKPVCSGEFWYCGLALLLFVLAGVLLRWRHSRWRNLLQKPFALHVVGTACLLVIALYCALTFGVSDAFWFFFDPKQSYFRLIELSTMLATIYSLWLLWKYRKQEPTMAALAFMMLAYLPVITYLGWHYTVAAWFIRCAYWGVILKCVWLDLSPIVLSLWKQSALRFHSRIRGKETSADVG
ncbi:MAG: hypothetical protein ABI210_04380 [Abditibacteriaceae bacterium]